MRLNWRIRSLTLRPSYETAGSFPGVTVSLAAIGIIPFGSEAPFRDYKTYGDLVTVEGRNQDGEPVLHSVTFYEESETGEGDHFSVSETGDVVVREINTAGSYAAVIAATSGFFTGVARFTLSVQVNSNSDLLFAGHKLAAKGETVHLSNINEADDPAGPAGSTGDRDPRLTTLPGVDMVYHGVSRGLHWIYGENYFTNPNFSREESNQLDARNAWYSRPICETEGNKGLGENSQKWRLPTLIEMAGGVLPSDTTETEIVARVNGAFSRADISPLDVFDINGIDAVIDFVTLTVKGKSAEDAGPLPKPDGIEINFEYFAGLFNAGVPGENQRGNPANVRYEANRVEIGNGDGGRVVCVRSTDGYQDTHVWAEVSVEDGSGDDDDAYLEANKASVALTAAAETVTANVTVRLGLFDKRGRETPDPVTVLTKADLTVTRLDEHGAFFTVDHAIVGDGDGAVLEVSALDSAESNLRSGEYVLLIAFAPAGNKYFGYGQQHGFGRAGRGTHHETQFYPIQLTVNWTQPPVAAFNFGAVEIAKIGDRVTVGATDWGFDDPISDSDSSNLVMSVGMEYLGVRGNLDVMFEHTPTSSDSVNYGTSLCDAGGADWRRPKLTELAMLLTPESVTVLTVDLELVQSVPGSESTSGDLVLTFPALETGSAPLRIGGDATGPLVHTGLYSNRDFRICYTVPAVLLQVERRHSEDWKY